MVCSPLLVIILNYVSAPGDVCHLFVFAAGSASHLSMGRMTSLVAWKLLSTAVSPLLSRLFGSEPYSGQFELLLVVR